jgi:hypothetical protein
VNHHITQRTHELARLDLERVLPCLQSLRSPSTTTAAIASAAAYCDIRRSMPRGNNACRTRST